MGWNHQAYSKEEVFVLELQQRVDFDMAASNYMGLAIVNWRQVVVAAFGTFGCSPRITNSVIESLELKSTLGLDYQIDPQIVLFEDTGICSEFDL